LVVVATPYVVVYRIERTVVLVLRILPGAQLGHQREPRGRGAPMRRLTTEDASLSNERRGG
jgi:hypothetical protein